MVPYGLNIKENEGGWCLYRANWWGLKEQVIIHNHLRNQFGVNRVHLSDSNKGK